MSGYSWPLRTTQVDCCEEEEAFAQTIACYSSFKHNFPQERTQVRMAVEHTYSAWEMGTVNGPQACTSKETQNRLVGLTAVVQKQS